MHGSGERGRTRVDCTILHPNPGGEFQNKGNLKSSCMGKLFRKLFRRMSLFHPNTVTHFLNSLSEVKVR